MKKQFLRFKQITDQTFLRIEKTEVLTQDLSEAEKRVDIIKQSCQNLVKKITSCIQRLSQDLITLEKRQKKIPEILLAQSMQESSIFLGDESILGLTFQLCAKLQTDIAAEQLDFKTKVEKEILEPIQYILKTDIPNITKLRKQLTRLTMDMDLAKTKYNSASKNASSVSGNNLVSKNSSQVTGSNIVATKVENLKEEMEDAMMKVSQCKYALATEMFTLISREPEISCLLVKWYSLQAEYHQKTLAALETDIPNLEKNIKTFLRQPVFGVALEEHVKRTNRTIASFIEFSVCQLLDALHEEGLFRIAGSIPKVKQLKSTFDAGIAPITEDITDPHTVAGALKLYLRNLPEPLLTFSLYNDWVEASRMHDRDTRLQSLWQVVNNLPKPNFENLRYLVKFLSKVTQNAEVNKMSSQNLAIVMAPNLIWSPTEEVSPLGVNMTIANLHSSIVDNLITYADYFFPGDIEFHLSLPNSMFWINNISNHIEGRKNSLDANGSGRLTNGESATDSSLSSANSDVPYSISPMMNYQQYKKSPLITPPFPVKPNSRITRSVSCGLEIGHTPSRLEHLLGNERKIMKQSHLYPLQDEDLEQSFEHRKSLVQSWSHEDLLSFSAENNISNRKKQNSIELYDNVDKTSCYSSEQFEENSNSLNNSQDYINDVTKFSKCIEHGIYETKFGSSEINRKSSASKKLNHDNILKSIPSAHNYSEMSDDSSDQHSVVDIDSIVLTFSPSGDLIADPISYMDDSDQDDDKTSAKTSKKIFSSKISHSMPSLLTHTNGQSKDRESTSLSGISYHAVIYDDTRKPLQESVDLVQSEDKRNGSISSNASDSSSLDASSSLSSPISTPEKMYCTVIQVGNSSTCNPNGNDYVFPGNRIKSSHPTVVLPSSSVNSSTNNETQDTRL